MFINLWHKKNIIWLHIYILCIIIFIFFKLAQFFLACKGVAFPCKSIFSRIVLITDKK